MTFTGPVTIESTDPGSRSLRIKANTRETRAFSANMKASGQSFAMLHGEELVVRLHPRRCAELVDAGKGRLLAREGETNEEWLVIEGLDAAEWTAHTMEALACARD